MMRTRIVAVVVMAGLGLLLVGGTCGDGNSVYSEKCQNLSETLNRRIAELAGQHAACAESADCTYAAVVVPCNRDSVVDAAIAVSEVEAFRDEIAALAGAKCTSGNIDDCNAHCGTGGSLIFPTADAACRDERCILVANSDSVGGSLPSSEICHPTRYVYLPADIEN